MSSKRYGTNRGNILFLILLAIVLLAALVIAVNNSQRGAGKDASSDKADLLAAQIVQIGSLTENMLQRFMLMTDLKVGNIDLFSSYYTTNGDVSGCSSNTCNLFNSAGGNVTPPLGPPAAYTSTATTCNLTSDGSIRSTFMMVSVAGVGTTAPDLVMQLCGLRDDVCKAINRKTGAVKEGGTDITQQHTGNGTGYAPYSSSIDLNTLSLSNNNIGSLDPVGARAFCALRPSSDTAGSRFYQVLWSQ